MSLVDTGMSEPPAPGFGEIAGYLPDLHSDPALPRTLSPTEIGLALGGELYLGALEGTPCFAAAVEACASSGGQITPPIMGAAAFIIAEYCNMTYLEVVRAAAIPAFARVEAFLGADARLVLIRRIGAAAARMSRGKRRLRRRFDRSAAPVAAAG